MVFSEHNASIFKDWSSFMQKIQVVVIIYYLQNR